MSIDHIEKAPTDFHLGGRYCDFDSKVNDIIAWLPTAHNDLGTIKSQIDLALKIDKHGYGSTTKYVSP